MVSAKYTCRPEDVSRKHVAPERSVRALKAVLVSLAAAAAAGAGLAVWLAGTPLGKAHPQDWFLVFFVIFARNEPAGLALITTFTAATLVWIRRGAPAVCLKASQSRKLIILAALVSFAVAAAGTSLVFRQYALTPDENMADFQARIFLSGQIHQKIPDFWVPLVHLILPSQATYLPATHSWMSGYLPVYAALRAVFMSVNLEWFTNPFLAAVSVLAIAAVARKVWPNDPWKPALAAGLLAASPQFLVMSMTAYAMPAHLALNLIWLWLYCDAGRRRFWVAPFVGVAALGLHQPFFHALFAAPFLLRLVLNRRWKASIWFGAIYLIGIICWYSWWHYFVPANTAGASSAFGVHRFTPMVQMMYLSLLLGWMALPIPLLAVLGFSRVWNHSPFLRDLAFSCILTFGFYIFIRADQAHGWGDRYFYGAVGCLVLVAVAGWDALARTIGKQAAATFAVGGMALALIVQSPLRAVQAADFAEPFVRANEFFRNTKADVVAFDASAAWYSNDLKRSDPLWREGPIVLSIRRITEPQAMVIQQQYPNNRIITPEELAAFGLATEPLSND